MFWFDSNNSNAGYSYNHLWGNNNINLYTTQEFQKYWTTMAEILTQALLTKDLEISIILERDISAACCIRGYHIYNWTQWTTEIGSILTSEPEKRPGALVEDKYAIAIISNNQTVGHVPKFLSKLTFFFLKHGTTLTVKVTRERRYSFDLPQGGMEIPAEFSYKSEKKKLIDQMKEKALDEIKKYDERTKKRDGK